MSLSGATSGVPIPPPHPPRSRVAGWCNQPLSQRPCPLVRVRKRGNKASERLRLAQPCLVGRANSTRRDQRLPCGPHTPFAGLVGRPSSRFRLRQPASQGTGNTRVCSGSQARMRLACLCNRPIVNEHPQSSPFSSMRLSPCRLPPSHPRRHAFGRAAAGD